MTRKALILSAGMLGVALAAGAAQAGTKTWVGGTDSWNTASNWSPVGVPGSADDVVIGPPTAIGGVDPIVDVTTQVQTLDMKNGGILNFRDGHDLTVTGLVNVEAGGEIDINSNGSELIISGVDMFDVDSGGVVRINEQSTVLRLSGASSAGNPIDGHVFIQNGSAKLDITANVTVTGNGKIEGNNDFAQIAIASGSTFTSSMASAAGGIRGSMQITGSGTFVSHGRVEANAGTLEFVTGLAAVTDNGSAIWAVASAQNSRLLFSRSATTLQGDFVTASELELGGEVDVWTCGELSYNAGSMIDLDTANSKSFRYFTFGSSSCTNPSDGTTAGCSDNTVFTVNTDKLTPCS